MAADNDFAALYRELGIDATCSLTDFRGAWRRRVAQLHPDQGGDAEDTGRLQELNRLYDAALDFHTRFGRLPGASHGAQASTARVETRPERAVAAARAQPAAGFGRLSRYFVAASLAGIAVLTWRIAASGGDDTGMRLVPAADVNSGAGERHPAQVAIEVLSVAPGMDKQNVENILGAPQDMHELRWSYGPSWVEFHCGKVVAWYSAPERPLRVMDALESYADTSISNTAACD